MNERRRRFLCCLGGTGLAPVTGCLRLEQSQSTTGDGESRSARSTESGFGVAVIGRQFRWEFAYPEFDVSEREELVLPVETSVELEVRSEDVYHSFGIEGLDVKVDALPGEWTQTTITPETTGEYDAACYELCGDGHSEMTAPVRVVSETEFENWRS